MTEKVGSIKGIGLVLASESAIREMELKRKVYPSSFVHPLNNFNNVMPEPREAPLSEIVGHFGPRQLKKKRKAKPKRR